MTFRLDLRKRPDPTRPGPAMLEHTILVAKPFGHADCGQWFSYARQLVEHVAVCDAGQVEWDG